MILIGQYDSPFVRRVGIALTLYGLPFEHRPWSVFGDAAKISAINPLCRVPTLVLDDGLALTDSHMILDYLDGLMPPDKAMFPREEPGRHQALRRTTLATGLAEKAVSLFYERRLHETASDVWVKRCEGQIIAVATRIEAERAPRPGPWWHRDRIGHEDIALACALRFVCDAHTGLLDMDRLPSLGALTAHAESLPVFKDISQPFIPPT
jgi:glutathione S-transferase